MADKAPDVLGDDSRPLFFPVSNARELGLAAPANRRGVAVRTWVRSLSGMQKEALVIQGGTDRAWRLTSDEGPYLAGYDVAPCPLSFLTTGMVASYMNEIRALAAVRSMGVTNLRLVLDNLYTMEGSALRGTMLGGALPPQLQVEIDSPADEDVVRQLVQQAIEASPISGLMRGEQTSLFTLSHNGKEIEVDRVAPLGAAAHPDPGDRFPSVEQGPPTLPEPIVRKLRESEARDGVKHGTNSSLQESQSRNLHIQGICTLREDGVKRIEQHLFKPIGSSFRFLSDEAPEHGGGGRAPDAASYISAGIGFCFMTQLGRYTEILRKPLTEYRIVQDTHFSLGSLGGAAETIGAPGVADPVETHAYLVTPEPASFAQRVLDMGEQTCFLHAFCRTPLSTELRLQHLSGSRGRSHV